MHQDHAVKVVRNFRRYRQLKSGKTQWYQAGQFTPQDLIPICTAAQKRRAHEIIGLKRKRCTIREVSVRSILSWQRALRFKSLMWNVKHAREMQRINRSKDPDVRGKTLPTLVDVGDGHWVLWNGNHRTTANILHGMTHVRARCFKPMPARRSRASR